MANHRDTLLELVAEVTDQDTRVLSGLMQAPLADAGLDSIRAQELLARLEDAYDVEISPEDAVHLDSLAKIERFLKGMR